MIPGLLLAGALLAAAAPARAGEDLVPVAGRPLVLRGPQRGTDAQRRVAPGAWLLPPTGTDGRGGVIVLERVSGLVLDLEGVSLRGTDPATDPDRNAGWGLVLRDCEDVTIRGGTLGGYKGCLVAEGCRRLVLQDIAFDGWYRQRLLSTPAAEDLSDWLYPHVNEDGEWLANHGAAISLTGCTDVTVSGCRGRHGQNGILLTRCEGGRLHDNDFSFLSGWGLALYRTGHLLVSHNRFDYCVRGYSDGAYWRGQDSAGILMFERCCDNVFVANSATHGGDGVFLFAGRDSVEGLAARRGERDAAGSDRNVWYGNDFSWAVANAIEATFSSDNWAIGNRLVGSHQHGVWGGYSRRLVVLDNTITDTLGGGISIEHGQECALVGNELARDEVAVELWWDEDGDLVGGPFGRAHDTASRDHLVAANRFDRNGQDLVLRRTTGVALGANEVVTASGQLVVEDGGARDAKGRRADVPTVTGGLGGEVSASSLVAWDGREPEWLARARAWRPPADLPGSQVTFAAARGQEPGLDSIVMGEWGPWDFPSGEPRPEPRRPGGLLADARWQATWFRWDASCDPRERPAAWRRLARQPLARAEVGNFADPWAGDAERRRLTGHDRFGLVATTSVTLPASGDFRLSVVSDDGVRLLVDGRVALEDWTWHAPTRGEAVLALKAGPHELSLEYFQIDGATALLVELAPAR